MTAKLGPEAAIRQRTSQVGHDLSSYGWAPVGHRLVDAVPHGHWKTSTFIAGLRQDRLVAPCVFNGAINSELFLAYVEQVRPPR